MKAGDMVMQAEFVARWARDRRLAFVGDGDSISVCVAYLFAREIIDYGPSRIDVFDFDERMVSAIKRFADHERLETLDAHLYNCLDPLSTDTEFDCFYTNPPWGQSNGGDSVNVFIERGMELVRFEGEGLVVIADDKALPWTQDVLANVQAFAATHGFFVARLMPELHAYHLDDAPDLLSCNLLFRSRPDNRRVVESMAITDPDRLVNFYGAGQEPRVRYIRERKRVDYGKAHDDEYQLDVFEGQQ
jgi:predicted methyltransferase